MAASLGVTSAHSYVPAGHAYVLTPVLGEGCCKYDGIGIRFATRDFAMSYAVSLGLHSFKIIKEHPRGALHKSVWQPDLNAWIQDTIPKRQRANSI